MHQNPRFDRPVDVIEDEDGVDEVVSDYFELRACHDCGVFLPLDKAANIIDVGDDDVIATVCDKCFQSRH